MAGTLWTKDEDDLVRNLYPNIDRLILEMPHRTRTAIRKRAAFFGMTKRPHAWTGAEVKRLRAAFAKGFEAERAAFPHLTRRQIHNVTKAMGLRRSRRTEKIYGLPGFDDIRKRANTLGVGAIVLNELVGSTSYFSHAPHYVSWDHLATAAEYLGGHLEIEWSDD